jgi:hypothetical protein
MRIEVVGEGHIFQGTAKQIVAQMHSLAFGAQHLSLREYIDWNVANIGRGVSVEILVTGETDEERAGSFLGAMIEHGYARSL